MPFCQRIHHQIGGFGAIFYCNQENKGFLDVDRDVAFQ
jgi:hypothetical protein